MTGRPFRRPRKKQPPGTGVAVAGSVVVHALAGISLLGFPEAGREPPPTVYAVELVAAPRPEPQQRRAPEAVERPQPREPAVPLTPPPPRRQPTPAPPRPAPEPEVRREPAPRTTPREEPLPAETPSTGTDVGNIKVEGTPFPYPEYLRNIVAQVYRRWQRPGGQAALRAEVMFFIHRDGSVSNLRFTRSSGNFAFDLEVQGAIEAAGNVLAFGPLPEGFGDDILPVSFFFDPRGGR